MGDALALSVPPPVALADRDGWCARYRAVRGMTEALAAPLTPEDQQVQSMTDASPAKWHRAHTTWFFETFVLQPHVGAYEPFHPRYGYLFNSYYEAAGPRHARPARGLLTRPGAAEIARYRSHVDAAMERLMRDASSALWNGIALLVELGLHHEQQHQELLLTDIKHAFWCNPLKPAYAPAAPGRAEGFAAAPPAAWVEVAGGVCEIGHDGAGFAFDNEGPRHRVWLDDFALAVRPVTNGEYLAFLEDGGYRRPGHWLSDGWATVQAEGWRAPIYWEQRGGVWLEFTLAGLRPVEPAAPVVHLSYYEADAYARWAGARLPTEAEWERAARTLPPGEEARANLLASGRLHPVPSGAPAAAVLAQMIGDVWEWTGSAYAPYPGFRPAAGAIGEYNGKFMANQMTLRGGSCVTPPGHVRITYRNFFYPHQRWQFAGLRLARAI